MDPGRDGGLPGDGPELPVGNRDGQEGPEPDDAQDAGYRPKNHDLEADRGPIVRGTRCVKSPAQL